MTPNPGPTPNTGQFGYCMGCYHPLDRCSHCDAPSAPLVSPPGEPTTRIVIAPYVLGGWSRVVHTDAELVSAIQEAIKLSPLGEADVREGSVWRQPVEAPLPGERTPPTCATCHEAHGYLSRLFKWVWPQCEPLPTLMGVCTQIDNGLVGFLTERSEAAWRLKGLKGRETETTNEAPPSAPPPAETLDDGWVHDDVCPCKECNTPDEPTPLGATGDWYGDACREAARAREDADAMSKPRKIGEKMGLSGNLIVCPEPADELARLISGKADESDIERAWAAEAPAETPRETFTEDSDNGRDC